MNKILRAVLFFVIISMLCANTVFAYVHEISYMCESNNPPYRYVHNGNYEGFEVDFSKIIFRDFDYNVNYSFDAWEIDYEMVKMGLIDTCGLMAVNERRKQEVLFSKPVLHLYTSIYTRKDFEKVSLNSIHKYRIGAVRARFTEDILKEQLGIKNYATYLTITDAINALKDGQIDILIENQEAVNNLLVQKSLMGEITPQITDLFPFDVAYGVKKSDVDLVEYINLRIDELQKSGVYEELYQKYFHSHSSYYLKATQKKVTDRILFISIGTLLLFIVLYIYIKYLKKRISRANQEIYERHEQLKVTLSSIGDGVVATDNHGKIEFANKAAEKLIGINASDVLGESIECIINFVDEETQQSVALPFKQTIKEGKGISIPNGILLVSKYGTQYPIMGSIMPIMNDDSSILGAVLVFQDVTERKNAVDIIKRERDFTNSIYEYASMFILVIRPDGSLTKLSKYAEAVTGYSFEEVSGRKWLDKIVRKDMVPFLNHMLEQYGNGDAPRVYEMPILCRDGSSVDILWNNSVIFDKKGNMDAIISMGVDISERNRTEEKMLQSFQQLEAVHEELTATEEELRYQYDELRKSQEALTKMAYYDSLTELPNRSMLSEKLKERLERAETMGHIIGVLFMDLDNFKPINDTFGHAFGDMVLRSVADMLKSSISANDLVGRQSGDEFVIVLSDVLNIDDIKEGADRILHKFQQPLTVKGHEIYITASMGISVYPYDGRDEQSLIKNADTAMYNSKELGKNNYQFYTKDMYEKIVNKLNLERDLRHAVKNNEITVFYQPLVDIKTGEVVGLEALVRWFKPGRGYISPSEFIPIAEETGLILTIDEHILRMACKQIVAWQEAGVPPVRVSVNLSARQFQQQNIVEGIKGILDESGLDPKWLSVEITEGVAMKDFITTVGVMKRLRNMGIEVSLDDFGTGYSSLSYLKQLPIDILKIDKSFIHEEPSKEGESTIIKVIIMLAQSLGINVVAEGVETHEQLEFLKDYNCDIAQGFLFSKPAAPTDIEGILKKRRFIE